MVSQAMILWKTNYNDTVALAARPTCDGPRPQNKLCLVLHSTSLMCVSVLDMREKALFLPLFSSQSFCYFWQVVSPLFLLCINNLNQPYYCSVVSQLFIYCLCRTNTSWCCCKVNNTLKTRFLVETHLHCASMAHTFTDDLGSTRVRSSFSTSIIIISLMLVM